MAPRSVARAAFVTPAIAALAACTLVLTRWEYVPIWDGRTYADCIVAASDLGRASNALRCMGHVSHAYIAAMALGQQLASDPFPMMLGMNVLLFGLGCLGFWRLIRLVMPLPGLEAERAVLLAAFIVQPSFLAAVIQPSLDLALLPGFLWCCVWLLEHRVAKAAAVGTLMTFTKETGVLLYAMAVGCWVIWQCWAPGGLGRMKSAIWSLVVLAVPPILFSAYISYRIVNHFRPLIGTNAAAGGAFLGQLLVPRLDLYLVNFFVLTLVLNFAWIPAAGVLIDFFVGAAHRLHRLRRAALGDVDASVARFVVLAVTATALALSRFITYGNSRYYLVPIALLPIVFVIGLHRLRVRPRFRFAILFGYATLLFASNVRTIDPVSRSVYGTFAVGRHDFLRMTRVTGECCGAGQDQLAYSPQFTVLHDLVDDALANLAPTDSSLLIVPDSTAWFQIGPLDSATHRRTLRRTRVVRIPVSEPVAVIAMPTRPRLAYYLALPNGNNARALTDLSRVYDVGPEQRFLRQGYSLSAYVLHAPSHVQ